MGRMDRGRGVTAATARERWLSYGLRRWANARTRRNPFGHGKTGTALLNDAADYIDKLEADVQFLVGSRDHWRELAYRYAPEELKANG